MKRMYDKSFIIFNKKVLKIYDNINFKKNLYNVYDNSGVIALLKFLTHKKWDIRASATRALALLGELQSVEPLMKMLIGDTEDIVRLEAAKALGKLGDQKALVVLALASKQDESQGVQKAAEDSIKMITDPTAFF